MMIFQQIEPLNQWNKNEKHCIIMDECLHVPCIMAECLRVPCVMFPEYGAFVNDFSGSSVSYLLSPP